MKFFLLFCIAGLSLLKQLPVAQTGMGFLKSSKDTGRYLVWDSATATRISAPGSAAFYPRMIQLKSGALLCVYTCNGTITATKSTNGGQAWTPPYVIADKEPGINRDNAELLQLRNGRLLLCYASRPQSAMRGKPEQGKNFDIRIRQSRDDGATWAFEKVLYTAGASLQEACWEPGAVQLPCGEVQLFFSDEAPYTKSNEQNISMLRSFDNGATWTASPQVISFRAGSRDGMPVPLWLQSSKTVAVAIEDPGVKNFKPYIIQSARGGKWTGVIDGNSPARHYALKDKLNDSTYAGAPYLRQLSTGETVLSFQSAEGRRRNKDNNAVMVVALGDAACKTFDSKTIPFLVPEGKHALWSSLCEAGDTLIALTSTNAFSNVSEIWMIKGRVKH